MQFNYPEQFQILQSCIPTAGLGLFFKGKAFKNDFMCGYGGKVSIAKYISSSKYAVRLGNTKYAIDAIGLRSQCSISRLL